VRGTSEFGDRLGENETQRKITNIMRASPKASAKAVAGDLGITSRAVEKNISVLKELGLPSVSESQRAVIGE
jgi:predicted ArsR family transcriptional regulator